MASTWLNHEGPVHAASWPVVCNWHAANMPANVPVRQYASTSPVRPVCSLLTGTAQDSSSSPYRHAHNELQCKEGYLEKTGHNRASKLTQQARLCTVGVAVGWPIGAPLSLSPQSALPACPPALFQPCSPFECCLPAVFCGGVSLLSSRTPS